MNLQRLTVLMVIGLALIAAGCANPPAVPTPTLETVLQASITPTEPPTVSPMPSLTSAPQLAPTDTLVPLTPTPEATPTPSVAEYVIQPGDTLIDILRQPPFNYSDLSVITLVVRLNPTMPDADRLPPPGTTILIPLPTLAPTQPGQTGASVAVVQPQVGGVIIQHAVVEGETILGIAEQYRTTLRVLRELNPAVAFTGCDFSNPSGGPDCTVLLEVGQPINVPAPTPTPTLSPTPSGSETPTPTPTFAAPRISFPPLDAVINAATPFTLQWVSSGFLEARQVYLVQVEDVTSDTAYNDITTATSYRLPGSLVPPAGQSHQFRWRVSVAQQDSSGRYEIIGGQGDWRTFSWNAGG